MTREVDLDIKGGRKYAATTLKQYADPVFEAGRRAAAYLAQLTSGAMAAAETTKR